MNSRRLIGACFGLTVGLLFYAAYRSGHTLSNRLIASLCGPTAYLELKHELQRWLPLPVFLRGCLPSALWCFIATSLVGGWKIRRTDRHRLELAWLPPFVNASWEIVQWLRWTDGRADWRDAVAGFVGWAVAQLMFCRRAEPSEEISALWNWRMAVVAAGFCCMGFADVWK